MPTKLDRALKYVHKARITCARSSFPMDMLRYDRCVPFGPDDVYKMLVKPRDNNADPVIITVIAYAPTQTSPFTVARWNSFGASVQVL